MSLPVVILTLVLLSAVILVVSAPLRARAGRQLAGEEDAQRRHRAPGRAELERQELEAAREAKYREIRDAELDYRTGKLSREDYEAIDRALRVEAMDILRRLDAVGA